MVIINKLIILLSVSEEAEKKVVGSGFPLTNDQQGGCMLVQRKIRKTQARPVLQLQPHNCGGLCHFLQEV